MKRCEVENCENKHFSKGMCKAHYLRMYRRGNLELMRLNGYTAYEKVMIKSEEQENGCRIFKGCILYHGYGQIRDGDKMKMAHRVTFEHKKGKVPDGFEIDHLCRNRACVNPEHMEIVTHVENVRRGIAGHTHHLIPRNELGQFTREKGLV